MERLSTAAEESLQPAEEGVDEVSQETASEVGAEQVRKRGLRQRAKENYTRIATKLIYGEPEENKKAFFKDQEGKVDKRKVAAAAGLGVVGAAAGFYVQQKTGVELDSLKEGAKGSGVKKAFQPAVERAGQSLETHFGYDENKVAAARMLGFGALSLAGNLASEGAVGDTLGALSENLDDRGMGDQMEMGINTELPKVAEQSPEQPITPTAVAA